MRVCHAMCSDGEWIWTDVADGATTYIDGAGELVPIFNVPDEVWAEYTDASQAVDEAASRLRRYTDGVFAEPLSIPHDWCPTCQGSGSSKIGGSRFGDPCVSCRGTGRKVASR